MPNSKKPVSSGFFCCFKSLCLNFFLSLLYVYTLFCLRLPACQPPRCVQQQEKCQLQGEEIKAKPECGRRSAGDGGAAQQPGLQGVSQVKCSSKPMKRCLITSTQQHCSICRVCVISKLAAPEENQENSDGLINSNVSPLPASCIRPKCQCDPAAPDDVLCLSLGGTRAQDKGSTMCFVHKIDFFVGERHGQNNTYLSRKRSN